MLHQGPEATLSCAELAFQKLHSLVSFPMYNHLKARKTPRELGGLQDPFLPLLLAFFFFLEWAMQSLQIATLQISV